MDTIKQRIAIAKAQGYTKSGGTFPDYLNDLNAMHEAEKFIAEDTADLHEYAMTLTKIAAPSVSYGEYSCTETFRLAHATAAQRAEAFLRTLNLWTEE